MIRYSIISYYIILLLLPVPSAAAVYSPILEQIKPGTITIIGEIHKRIESVELFQSLVSETIRHDQCVVIALEIASDQQATLDSVIQGRVPASAIELWPAIDYPSYRRMIEAFAELKRQGQCITLVAIDSGMDNAVDRDLWMALSLAEQAGDSPVLVLLGALHTLKRVDWKHAYGRPSVAEILTARGFRVSSYPQRWLPDQCANSRTAAFVDNRSPRALGILNGSLMSLINAKRHKSAQGVVEGFVVWECDNLSRDDLPHSRR
jgi:DNA-binding transcriptional regulator YdaS (Cro superfamily)